MAQITDNIFLQKAVDELAVHFTQLEGRSDTMASFCADADIDCFLFPVDWLPTKDNMIIALTVVEDYVLRSTTPEDSGARRIMEGIVGLKAISVEDFLA